MTQPRGCIALALVLGACSSHSNADAGIADANADTYVDKNVDASFDAGAAISISGTVEAHPINAALTPDGGTVTPFTGLSVAIVNAETAFVVPDGGTLAGPSPLTGCSAGVCPWSFPTVADTTIAGLGLVAEVLPASGTTAWIPTSVNIANAGMSAADTSITNAVAFGVSTSAATALETMLSLSPGSLVANGFILGTVTSGSTPVAGAEVSDVSGNFSVLYPFAASGSTGTSTSGTFVAIPLTPASTGETARLVVTATDGGTDTWSSASSVTPQFVTSVPGTCFVTFEVATVENGDD